MTGPRKLTDGLLDAAVDIRMNPDDVERSYMARQLVQCTLPHSDPGNVMRWSRTNGHLTLAIRPYVNSDNKALYPYGSIPRLILFWLVTETTQKKSRHIRLGNSLDAFMREIGLNPRTGGGKRGDAARLHSQMERLFRAIITFEDRREWSKSYVDMQIAPKGMLWWDPAKSHQDNLWESWIELGEDFYAAITAAPVPVDMRALRALKRSPLALDLYAWLAHTAFTAELKNKPRVVPWNGLHGQMGAEYAELRQFRANVALALRKIKSVYPGLKVEMTQTSLIVHPSRAAIPSKSSATPSLDSSQDTAVDPIVGETTAQRTQGERIHPKVLRAAHAVMAACGLSDDNLEPIIAASLIARVTSAGGSIDQAAIDAIDLRREFVNLGELLKYTVGPAKFFSQGWCWDYKLWPLDREALRRHQEASVGR